MGKLTTHVLDTARGCPAAGMKIELSRVAGDTTTKISSLTTNADGRADAPLLEGAKLEAATYLLLFHVGEYFSAHTVEGAGKFLDVVPVRFIVSDPSANYHVPLLVSPWSYSTYRGS